MSKAEDKRPFGSPRSRWVDNIKMDPQGNGCKVMNWTDLSQDKKKWWAVVKSVMNFRVT